MVLAGLLGLCASAVYACGGTETTTDGATSTSGAGGSTSSAVSIGAELSGTFTDMVNGPSSLTETNGGNDSKYPSA